MVFAEELTSSNTFDMIVCMNVFLFLPDKQKILLKFNNLLKSKNSYLVIMEPIRFLIFDGKKSKKSKKLNKITDVLGQETPYRKNTNLFYIYDDGTVEKRIIIE